MNAQDRIAELEAEIEELKAEQQVVATWEQQIRSLSSFSDAEKCNMFDQIHAKAFWLVRILIEGDDIRDAEAALFRLAVETLGDNIWQITEGFWR